MLAAAKRVVSGDEQPLPANPFAPSATHTETDAAPSPRDSSNDSIEISHYSTPPTILSGVQSAEPSEPDAAAPPKDVKPDAAAVSAAVAAAVTSSTATATTTTPPPPEESRRKSVRARSSVATYSDTVLSGHAVHTRKSYRDEREFALAAATRASLAATALLSDADAPLATPSPKRAGAKDAHPASAKTSPLRKKTILRITRRASSRAGRFSTGAASTVKSASAVLEKRGRDALDGMKERLRAGILSRKRLRDEEETPSRKRARFQHPSPDSDEEAEKKAKAKQKPRKPWVEKGLYCGQDGEDMKTNHRPSKRRGDDRKYVNRPKAFPLPMYTGAILLEQGRDFKLPFSILHPLTRDQSPRDWKNLSKSKLPALRPALF
jgi:[histone H3]-lysine4 N-trimethyltransferase ASH1L